MNTKTVIKRDGNIVTFDESKIDRHLKGASYGLSNVDTDAIKKLAMLQFPDTGIETSKIEEILYNSAISLMEYDTPNNSKVASRLLLYSAYHEVGKNIGPLSFYKYLLHGIECGKLNSELLITYDYLLYHLGLTDSEFMAKYMPWNDGAYCFEYDLLLPYSATRALVDKNLVKSEHGLIDLPQFMHLANTLALYPEVRDVDEIIPAYELRAKLQYSLATPPTTNARKVNPTLASCYAMVAHDSIEGFLEVLKDTGLTSKAGAGTGIDITPIRVNGASIAGNPSASGGIVPFAKMIETVLVGIDQLGVRPGCAHLFMQPWHGDVEEFIDLKKSHGDHMRRTHKLLTSLWVNDLFMERVRNDEDWSLFCPSECPELITAYGDEFDAIYLELEKTDKVLKVVSAKKLYKEAIKSWFEDGGPMVSFKDEHNRRNANKHAGHIYSSNLCTEISQNTSPIELKMEITFEDGQTATVDADTLININGITNTAALITRGDMLSDFYPDSPVLSAIRTATGGEMLICNLASINLGAFTTMDKFEETIVVTVKALNRIARLNNFIADKVVTATQNYFAIAVGTMGEHEFLAKRKIKYGSPEHLAVIDVIYAKFSEVVIRTSAELSKRYGSYGKFEGSDWSKGILPIDTANEKINDYIDKSIDVTQYIGEYTEPDYDSLRELVKGGMANGYLMAPAPTASISINLGTTSSVEPIYKRLYTEENSSGLVKTMAPSLSPDTWEYYESAFDVDQKRLILAAGIRQKYVDQALSTNIFINKDRASMAYINDLLQLSNTIGLKGLYYLRSLSEEGENSEELDSSLLEVKCVGCE